MKPVLELNQLCVSLKVEKNKRLSEGNFVFCSTWRMPWYFRRIWKRKVHDHEGCNGTFRQKFSGFRERKIPRG